MFCFSVNKISFHSGHLRRLNFVVIRCGLISEWFFQFLNCFYSSDVYRSGALNNDCITAVLLLCTKRMKLDLVWNTQFSYRNIITASLWFVPVFLFINHVSFVYAGVWCVSCPAYLINYSTIVLNSQRIVPSIW